MNEAEGLPKNRDSAYYATRDEAAKAADARARPTANREQREYAYQVREVFTEEGSSFFYSVYVRGQSGNEVRMQAFDSGLRLLVRPGVRVSAIGHLHPDSPGVWGTLMDFFGRQANRASGDDLNFAWRFNRPMYIGTPRGMRLYEPGPLPVSTPLFVWDPSRSLP